MELGDIFLQNIYYGISLFLPVLVFAIRTQPRSHLVFRLIVGFLGLILLEFLPSVILFGVGRKYFVSANIDMAITFLVNFVLCTAYCLFCFRQTILCSVYCSIAGYCIQHIWGRIIDYEIQINLPQDNAGWVFLRVFLAMGCLVVICAGLYFLVIRKMNPTGGNYAENKTGQVVVALILIGLNNFYSAYAMELISDILSAFSDARPSGEKLNNFVNITSAMLAFLALFSLFGMYQSKKISTENDELNRMIVEQKKKFESEQSAINLINIKCHDLKHQLSAIEGKMSKEQINETVQAINIYDSTIRTGNEAIDIVFAGKQSLLKANNIVLTCLVDGNQLSYIPAYELYLVFSNAIDNAIESVVKLPEEKRKIHITQERKGNFLCIKIKNFFSGTIEFKDGVPKTSKGDISYHGFGVRSMSLIMAKYGGTLTIDTKGDVFILSLLFLLPEGK